MTDGGRTMKPRTIAAKVGAVTVGGAVAWAVAALLVFMASGQAGEDAGQDEPEQAQRPPATDTADAIARLESRVRQRLARRCEAGEQDCFNLWNACEPITILASLLSPDPFLVRSDGRESGEMVFDEDVEAVAESRIRHRGIFRSRYGTGHLLLL